MNFLSQPFRRAPSVSRKPLPADPPAPPPPARGFWARAAYAPLGDWFQPSSQRTLDARKIIRDARLPEPLPGLIYLGLRRSRRSRRQRAALARELTAVFSTSLAAGQTPEQIAERFREQEARGDFLPQSNRRPRIEIALPAPAAQWIDRLLARARLHPGQANDAAGELAEHFAARLASGESVETLIEQLGSPAHGARFLRQTQWPAAVLLPEPLRGLLDRVLRRARLWPSERRDVARELTDHFSDGLAAGCSAEQLAADFGDPRQAARLIRRAKLRGRPLGYRILRHALQGLSAAAGALIVAYALLFLRYVSGRPTIAKNYLTELNREERSAPPEERAWPLYREALMKLNGERPDARAFLADASADEYWPEVVAYLDKNQPSLELIRRAATKPRLGFVYGDPANRDFLAKFGGGADAHGESPERFNPMLIQCTIPQYQEMRMITDLLAADARLRLDDGDGEQAVGDITTLVAFADQERLGASFLVEQLLSVYSFATALRFTSIALAEHPEPFSPADLRQMAHRMAAFAGGGALRMKTQADRMMFHDLIQRAYTDDGHGGGRLTAQGLASFHSLFGDQWRDSAGKYHDRSWEYSTDASELLGPILMAEVAGRREMTELAERLFDRWQADFYDRPLWQWQGSAADAELQALAESPRARVRYLPVIELLGSSGWQGAAMTGQILTQRRDALLTAIALELYHRRHGAWPATLDELAPGLLPAVPLDRFTGRPLRYRLVEGRPLLYSCGTDGDDDGGRTPKQGNQIASQWAPEAKLDAETIASDWAAAHDGDWMLWPPPAEEGAQ